jgi:sulfate adenylyltransferase
LEKQNEMSSIQPHGGALINREVAAEERNDLVASLRQAPTLTLKARAISDLELIANGAFSPLQGFMGEADYVAVRDHHRLANGTVWTIPVTLSATHEEVSGLRSGINVGLKSPEGRLLGSLKVSEVYSYNKRLEAEQVYLTADERHPGVKALYSQGEFLVGGQISVLENFGRHAFSAYRFSPAETRAQFAERGWSRVVAFQTRNPVHRAHEYIQKCALETVDGLFLHPIVGETKADDIPADVRLRAYEVILENYYPTSRTMLGALPAAMRYAGPREAIFHAIIRKNFGCTHFIVGRDHAGVGNYYGTYDAQRIFAEFGPREIGITPMFFDNTFYCRRCDGMASIKTCPHSPDDHVALSGTRLREMLERGEVPPPEFTRPEVAQVLIEGLNEAEQAA